jgi:ubiquinone biosynthesis protein UbiJ
MFAAGRRLFSSLARSTGDYLVEEGRDVVGRLELNAFNEDVDRLRDDVARLEARLDRLSRFGVVRP